MQTQRKVRTQNHGSKALCAMTARLPFWVDQNVISWQKCQLFIMCSSKDGIYKKFTEYLWQRISAGGEGADEWDFSAARDPYR